MSETTGTAHADTWSVSSAEELRDIWPGAWFGPLSAEPFHATLIRRKFTHMRLEGVSASPYRYHRTSLDVAVRPADLLSINVVVHGELQMREGPLQYRAGPGDVFVHRNGAFSFECPTPIRTFRAVVAPRLMAPVVGVDRPLGLCPPSALTRAYSRFADEVLASALESSTESDDAVVEQSALTMQRGLVASVLRAACPPVRSRQELRAQIAAYIEQRLSDLELDIEQISRDLQISRRWLFRVVEDEPESIFSTIRRRRVERATRDLEQHPELTVQEIGRRNGFSGRDLFTRAFRSQHGRTPVEHRAALGVSRYRLSPMP